MLLPEPTVNVLSGIIMTSTPFWIMTSDGKTKLFTKKQLEVTLQTPEFGGSQSGGFRFTIAISDRLGVSSVGMKKTAASATDIEVPIKISDTSRKIKFLICYIKSGNDLSIIITDKC